MAVDYFKIYSCDWLIVCGSTRPLEVNVSQPTCLLYDLHGTQASAMCRR
jgi:hypothetical protein